MTSASNSSTSVRAARQPDLAQDVLQVDGQRHEQQPGEDCGGPGHWIIPGLVGLAVGILAALGVWLLYRHRHPTGLDGSGGSGEV